MASQPSGVILRVSIPAANINRTLRLEESETVKGTIERILKRNPVGAVDDFALFFVSSSTERLGEVKGMKSLVPTPDSLEGVWLIDENKTLKEYRLVAEVCTTYDLEV